MKKMIVMLLALILTLSATAFAATYTHEDDIRFEYDETAFEIAMDDHTDDEDMVVLSGKNEAWGNTFVRIHLAELDDGTTFPTMEELAAMPGVSGLTQGEWNGFKDVFTYTVAYEDGSQETVFIAPVADEDGEIEDILTVTIGVEPIEDEDVAMGRDDLISAVLATLKLDD